ncbi:hypothetical protein N9A49_06440 [Salibacteraceae bacterium]|nr:hypothetical protein [Salibacteraceae bacterium]
MKKHILILSIMSLFISLESCKKDDDDPELPQVIENEPESITKVRLSFESTNPTGKSFTAEWSDSDGVGGNLASIDTIRLDSGQMYDLDVSFIDGSGNSEEDLTIEIQNESDEHLVCFESGLLGTALSNTITDSDGTYPIGIQSEWIVNSKANGTITISLKHQPDGLKNGSCDVGETDVEIEFPVVID